MEEMQNSLRTWREKEIKKLEAVVNAMAEGEEKRAKQAGVQQYKQESVMQEVKPGEWELQEFDVYRDVLPKVTCPLVDGFVYAPWSCYHQECGVDHGLDFHPVESDPNGSLIKLWIWASVYECALHKVCGKECAECANMSDDDFETLMLNGEIKKRPGKPVTKKRRRLMATPIGRFVDVHYKPMLNVYKYHMAYVNILGKHGCATRRREKPSNDPATMACAADYANKFQPNGFDSEFMTEGMSNDASVLMEGRSSKL